MTKSNHMFTRIVVLLAAVAAVLLLAACSVNVDDKKDGSAKKVEIQTPFASLKVNEQADVRDTGLPLYPGATPKPKSGDDTHSANVNISAGSAGLKVVAITYETNDAPDKVLSFYRDKISSYGKVLECKGGSVGHVTMKNHDDELHCDNKGDSETVELKVGTEKHQRVVAVKPSGKGSEFSLVYIRANSDKDDSI